MTYLVYPMAQNLERGQAENRGVLRQGVVDENEDMRARGLAGLPAFVTREESNRVRFYVFQVFEGQGYFVGPFMGLSEEIV